MALKEYSILSNTDNLSYEEKRDLVDSINLIDIKNMSYEESSKFSHLMHYVLLEEIKRGME